MKRSNEKNEAVGIRRLTPTYVLIFGVVFGGSVYARTETFAPPRSTLVVSKDAELCSTVKEALNDTAVATGGHGFIQPKWDALTSSIQWKKGRFKVAEKIYNEIEYATFDINNDGIPETVSRWNYWFAQAENSDLVVYSTNIPTFKGERIDDEFLPGVRSSAGQYGTYKIDLTDAPAAYRTQKKYKNAALSYFTIEPFMFKKNIYLLLSETFTEGDDDAGWRIVAEYSDETMLVRRDSDERTNKLMMRCIFEY